MDIQSLKIELVQKILASNKAALLKKVDQLFNAENNDNWWDELPMEVQESILLGLKEAEEGHVLTHEQVVQEAKEKYGF